MGVPKFFRYISERYPCLSEVIREYQIPEFDNLYLDMNGIIHVCSHPNDTDPHFRITEEKIFRDIFHYIETLFRMIQPQKLFFMAVDGVAPRAKMNQQRGRRFRSAKEAEVAEAKAKEKGEVLPSAERFDSNCITPGTEFMTRLQAQLKYFVTFKMSTDKLWQKVNVILSGHETPGEGEHKIMDYIRYMKSQPGYDPNTRHCLYGLDADLIMLGLCTHEPHFSLLREEVKYGKKNNQKRIPTPEETTFFLLHLSLMREYLDLEFQQLKTTLPFSYDLEHIIDDWVLMGFLVGNDFIPHLPELHINKGALPILYQTYIDVLPTLGGYINEGGTLRLDRFQKYMEKLAAFDLEQFKEYSADLRFFEGKTGRKMGAKDRHSYKNSDEPMSPPKNKDFAALIASTDEILEGSEDDDDNYIDIDSDDDDEDGTSIAEFCAHKNNYYIEKLEYEKVTPEVIRDQGEGYVRAIQWNLNYYYNGCCSWSWFYPHHYAPYISDIKNFSALKLEYDHEQPFLPFQQLLAVLPAASKKLLPPAYHDLMEDDTSPIISFYPTEFKTDLNGKRQDWEAVVLIPFIDQESLLGAMATKEPQLTEEEKSRNRHGPMLVYTYTPENLGSYVSPAYFPALSNHHAKVELVHREQLNVDKNKLIKGLCPGVSLDVFYPGFPTLKHIPFNAELQKLKVKVFDSPSQGDNMILTLLPQGHPDVSEVATQLIGKSLYVNWPHMFEARVVYVSSLEKRFQLNLEETSIEREEMTKARQAQWCSTKQGIEERYRSRMGIDIGKTEIIVYARTMEDKKFVMTDDKLHYEKQWAKYPTVYALQTTRTNIDVFEPALDMILTVEQLFTVGAIVFALDSTHYGAKGTVVEATKIQRVKVNFSLESEPNLEQMKNKLRMVSTQYMPGNALAHRLGTTSHLLSRITGTIYILSGDIQETESRPYKLNIGLNLKFNKRNEEVRGYTRRDKNTGYWMYSMKAEEEVREYIQKFPEVFKNLSKKSGSDDVHATDLYPEDTESKLSELSSWLKSRASMTAERQACGAQVLDEEVVLALEQYIDQFTKNEMTVKHTVVNTKPSNLYLPKPKLGQAADPHAVHQLFDRIVSVRESYTVPLGYKGTIIGIHHGEQGAQAMYDVLFDKEFTGGLKLCSSPHRGYRMSGPAFINLSYGKGSDLSSAQGKPTAVVEPSEFEEEVSAWNNNGHNSAFASWRNKPDQEKGSPLHSRNEQKSWRTPQEILSPPVPSAEQPARTRHSGHGNKAGNNKGGKAQSHPTVDPSHELKKILKIADETSKKSLPVDPRIPVNIVDNDSYCKQLMSLYQGRGQKFPRYLHSENKDGAHVCTVLYNNKEIQGAPSYTKDQAAESAARIALQCMAINEPRGYAGGGLSTAPYPQSKRAPLTSPQRPVFNPTNRLPQGPPVPGWTKEPAKPSTLPQPPTNWYQNSGLANFQPDWRSSGANRSNNPPFFTSPPSSNSKFFNSPPKFQPSQYNSPKMQQNQFVPYSPGQQSQMPQWQPRPPFIPLQAETRIRQQPHILPQSRDRGHEQRFMGPSGGKEQTPPRMPPSSAINTGRNSTRPPRSRIAANFAKPFTYGSPSE